MSTKSDLNEAAQQRSRTESKKNDESQRPKCASQVDLHESTTEPRVTRRRFALLTGVFRVLPTFLVIGALAGLGYFGHHHGWQVPKFSELAGNGNVTGLAWCDEHGVPEEICVACDAELMPKGTLYGWCKEHGVAECLLEHPELAQLKDSVTISSEDLDRARRALATRERSKNDPSCKMHLRRIQFASAEAADKAGIDIGLVDRGRIVETVSASGEIRYDPTRVTRLSCRAAGSIWRVEKNVGDPVREGDLLALVDAVVVGQAKAELLQAAAQLNLHDQTVQRLSGLGNVVAGSRLLEAESAREQAEAAVRKAIQILANLGLQITLEDVRGKNGAAIASQLQALGLPPSEIERLDKPPATANLVPVLAPRDGVVTARDVVAGEVVDTTRTLFTIVDNRRMWLLLDVALEDARYVKVGQQVEFNPDGGLREHSGQITWISSHIDSETRTVKVRAELPNDDGGLRDESFGAGRIVLREEDEAIIAPNDAIHWEGCCHVAFVRDKHYLAKDSYKVFHTRMVRPGVINGDYTEVIAGLLPGEVVVTKGSGVLRAELLKGNLGAG
ncbi:MAG: efflux RND transporter periplasmic adaptor subunit [Planctomycetales bacterium]|nr:efflux RND transporter periplasmic adaptor subunit [Planctomycetales bacterium]